MAGDIDFNEKRDVGFEKKMRRYGVQMSLYLDYAVWQQFIQREKVCDRLSTKHSKRPSY